MKAALRVVTYPLIQFGSIVAAVLMMNANVAPLWVVIGVPPIAGILIIGLEWVIPYRREWLRDHEDFRADCAHLVLSTWVVESLPVVAHGFLIAGAASVAGAVGRAPWPIEWPIWTQVVLALAISELFHYAIHRSLHKFGPLWRIHSVHHSSERLYWLNATRVHPFEGLFHIATGATALVVLGVPGGVLTIHAVFLGVARIFQHSNLDLALGPFNWIFSTNEVHRFHHSTERAEVDANYGTALLIWDWLFGTRRAIAAGTCPVHVGGPKLPVSWWGQVTSPFRTRHGRATSSSSSGGTTPRV